MEIDTWVSLAVLMTALAGFHLAMRRELRGFRTELKGDIAELRAEMRDEFGNVRTEFKGDIAKLRAEMRDEFGNVRKEVRDESGAVRREAKEDALSLRAHITRLEDRVDTLDDRIYALAMGLKPLIDQQQTPRAVK